MVFNKTVCAALLLSGGMALGYALQPFAHREGGAPGLTRAAGGGVSEKSAPAAEKSVLYWYDPMNPGVHFDKPGRSPFMDMDLVPRYAEDGAGAGIRIDPTQVQNLALRTEKVERGRLSFSRDIPANIAFNDYRLAKVQPRAEGFVEKVYPLAVGDVVQPGAPLADITVPGWASDQSEYLLLKNEKASAAIIRGVRERMRLSGMPEEMLQAVDATGKVQTRLRIPAPIGGVITALDVYPGMNVGKDMTIATIQGTDPIWITADVPERDIHLALSEKRMRIAVSAYPEQVFYAESFTLLPRADQETRTVPLRLSLDNADGLLRPGMTASVRLRGTGEEALLIPTQSLIDLGEEQRVITRAADGSFIPRRVRVLRSSQEKTAVSSGVEPGDEVVVSGLFLIDSEANLRGALERMRRDAQPGDAQSGDAQPGAEKPL
ncbi:MAG: efflux RND transporter periplasmic adaptor subunit [Deltaproteobacteria bacterium]|jgi:Cu(I)/Ag(I) efflux system membrane fusion protein|nr:efflux RND transporter periplasmic adaptor subunit [Deltaproteobacteria bacterium]